MPEIRTPKKGQGVPRETPVTNSLAALKQVLQRHAPASRYHALESELTHQGYFEAGMLAQIRMKAEAIVDLLAPSPGDDSLVRALAEAPSGAVREVAPLVVPLLFPSDLNRQLDLLKYTGAQPGTGIQELSQAVLHELVIEHGVATILSTIGVWVDDPEPTVRRLVAEALRPRGVMLPHIAALKTDPAPLKPLLESLLNDPSAYVRKAVANNLNDISKDHPDVVLAWAQRWNTASSSDTRRWILERGLRTLIKQGRADAFDLLGFANPDQLEAVWSDTLPDLIQINQLLPIDLHLHNCTAASIRAHLMVRMDMPGKGSKRRQSTYQLWKGILQANQSRAITKRIHFVDKNTQPKEAGIYHLTLVANGQAIDHRTFHYHRAHE